MNRFLLGTALLGAVALTGTFAGKAEAQFGPGFPSAPQAGAQGRGPGQSATLTLPPHVKNVVSIDAHNMLLAEVEDDDGNTSIVQMRVDHLYSGGIAQLFGGTVVPTGPFVSPGFANNGIANAAGVNSRSVGNQNGFNGGVFNSGGSGFNGTSGGFFPGNFGPNTTVSGTGIFAPQAQARK